MSCAAIELFAPEKTILGSSELDPTFGVITMSLSELAIKFQTSL